MIVLTELFTKARQVGEDILSFDLIATANVAGDHAENVTSIAFSNCSKQNGFKEGHIAIVNNEIIDIASVSFDATGFSGSIVAIRGTFGTLPSYIQNGTKIFIKTINSIRFLKLAKIDLLSLIPSSSLEEIFSTDAERELLKELLVLQYAYIIKNIEARETRNFIANITKSNYSDSVVSIGAVSENNLSPDVKRTLQNFLLTKGIDAYEYARA